MKHKVLLLDVLPGGLAEQEIIGYLSAGVELVVNMPQSCHLPTLHSHIERVSINSWDERQIESVARSFGGFDALKLRKNVPVGRELMGVMTDDTLARRLKIIGQAGVGLNHIDTESARTLGIDVINTPGSNASAVAEFTLLQMLALLRQTAWHQAQMRNGNWTKNARPPVRSLSDVSVGLIGSGAISQALIKLLKPFGSTVIVLGSSRFNDGDAKKLGVTRATDLRGLLNESDIISLHLPLNAETHYLINASVLACFRRGAYLINTSRGGLIDEKALAAFMREHPGWISGVALDAFEVEDEQFSTVMQTVEGALLTPHIAGTTETALLNAALRVQQGILTRLRTP